MNTKLAQHGTQRGYVAEIGTNGVACSRCQAAHRVYQRQFSKAAKAAGIKYRSDQKLDHLDKQGSAAIRTRPEQSVDSPLSSERSAEYRLEVTPIEPSLVDRMSRLIGQVKTPEPDSPYVGTDEPHEYIREIDHDPDPAGEQWEPINDEDIVINEAGLKKIQDNLGFYLVTVGITLEMIDPYCGSIAAQHADAMIEHWSKVIAHYPGIAKHFLSEKGGVIFAWINALQATWPVLKAIYDHHLAGNVKVEDGIIYKVSKQGEKRPMPDATMPLMPDSFDYSTR